MTKYPLSGLVVNSQEASPLGKGFDTDMHFHAWSSVTLKTWWLETQGSRELVQQY